MKYLAVIIFLIGCGSSKSPEELNAQNQYILAGQSNAMYCDWSPLDVVNIAESGADIDYLIGSYNYKITGSPTAIIFIHGETDARLGTDPDYYAGQVNYYRKLISWNQEIPFLVSTVGYDDNPNHDHWYDPIREIAHTQESWVVVFNNAYTFRDRGMLFDYIHYTQDGCNEIIDSIFEWEIKNG